MCIRVCTRTHTPLFRIRFSSLSVLLSLFIVFHSPALLFGDILIIEKRKVYHETSTFHNQLCVARARLLLSRIMLSFFFSRVWGSVRINWGISVRTVSGVICPVIATYEIEWFYCALTKSLFLRIDYFSLLHLSHKYITSSSFSSFSSSLFSFSVRGGECLLWITNCWEPRYREQRIWCWVIENLWAMSNR